MKSFGTKRANGILMRVKAVAFIICDWLMPVTFNESLSCSIFICFSRTRTFYWDQIMTTFTLWQSNRFAIELIEVTYAKTFIIKMLLLTLEHFFSLLSSSVQYWNFRRLRHSEVSIDVNSLRKHSS